MTKKTLALLCLSFVFSGCDVIRIITEVPRPVTSTTTMVYNGSSSTPAAIYTQPVAYTNTGYSAVTVAPKPAQTVITVQDYYQCLDLRAIGAAFAQSNSVREFEQLINSGQYMLTNLDLNGDGWVDYLRVMETVNGYTHVLTIQAVLSATMYQNVATLVVSCNPASTYVQVIGEPYIYGRNYIVEPVFVKVPPMYAHMRSYGYSVWTSPYHWNHFPNYYSHPAPVYVTHYQAYVNTYISSHTYVHEVHYVDTYRYNNYQQVSSTYYRNDYGKAHSEYSYESRHSDGSALKSEQERVSVVNNPGPSKAPAQETRTRTTPASSTSTASTASGSAASSAASTTSSRTSAATTATTSRTSAATTATTSRTSAATTTTSSRTSAATSTPVTSTVSSSTRTNVSAPAASTGSKATTTTSSRSTSTTTGSRSAAPSTTVTTRVNPSGTTRTTTTSVDANGVTTTTRRATTAPAASRSAASTTSSSRSATGTVRR